MLLLNKTILAILNAVKSLEKVPEELLKQIDDLLQDFFLPKERLEKFERVLKNAGSPLAVILTHLDPDSIACARIFARICEYFEIAARIFYCGTLDDPQNKFIWNKFRLVDDFAPIDRFLALKDADKYRTVLLDSSSLNDRRLGQLKLNPAIIIDHHPNKTNQLEETDDTWYLIHTCGAAVSLVTKLYLSLGLAFEQSDDSATLAVIGIKTDTKILDSTELDWGILFYLLANKYADKKRAKETEDSMKDMEYLKLFHQAYTSMKPEGNVCVMNLEFVPREKIGLIARLADEFCEYKGIDTVLIWAVSDDKTIYVKVRSVDSKLDLDDFIKRCFGADRGGAREGGKGAAMIPLDFFAPTKDSQDEFLAFLKKHIPARAFNPSAR